MTEHDVSYRCTQCGFDLRHPLWDFGTSVLGFADDDRFPGRCLLALREHYDHVDDVPGSLMTAYMTDVQAAGRAVRHAVRADRINYAALGNAAVTDGDLRRCRAIVAESGALASVEARLSVEYARALDALTAVPEPARAALVELASLAIERDA